MQSIFEHIHFSYFEQLIEQAPYLRWIFYNPSGEQYFHTINENLNEYDTLIFSSSSVSPDKQYLDGEFTALFTKQSPSKDGETDMTIFEGTCIVDDNNTDSSCVLHGILEIKTRGEGKQLSTTRIPFDNGVEDGWYYIQGLANVDGKERRVRLYRLELIDGEGDDDNDVQILDVDGVLYPSFPIPWSTVEADLAAQAKKQQDDQEEEE
jgi:hypothetical protein